MLSPVGVAVLLMYGTWNDAIYTEAITDVDEDYSGDVAADLEYPDTPWLPIPMDPTYPWAHPANVSGFYSQMRNYWHIANNARQASKSIDLIFYGDSITECLRGTSRGFPKSRCSGVPAVYQSYYASNYTSEVFAMGSETTETLMWRLLFGNGPQGLNSKVLSLNIGSNDLNKLTYMNDDQLSKVIDKTVKNTIQIVEYLRSMSDKTWVLLQAIFYERPGGSNSSRSFDLPTVYSTSADRVNAKLADWAAPQPRVQFVDCNFQLVSDDGERLLSDLYQDWTHLTVKGWDKMCSCFAPHIKELMRQS